MNTRRRFLKRTGLMAATPLLPGFVSALAGAEADQGSDRVLVVIQLDGGNDGLNTVVPYAQDAYRANRPTLALRKESLLTVDKEVGLNGGMRGAADLLEDGRLAIIQNVGYPNSDRSHFRSMAIWHTAQTGEELPSNGWAGRALDTIAVGDTDGVFVGASDLPRSLSGRRAAITSVAPGKTLRLDAEIDPQTVVASGSGDTPLDEFVQRNVLNAYKTAHNLRQPPRRSSATYPATALGSSLHTIAQFIGIEKSARVFYTIQTGYDTHDAQLLSHNQLLTDFSNSLKAFLDELKEMGLHDRVAVVAFSEFGRRVAENGSAGTDHGAAGPVFVAGSGVSGGMHGSAPNLEKLDGDDLAVKCDFRQIYAALLEQWLQIPARPVLGAHFKPLPIIKDNI